MAPITCMDSGVWISIQIGCNSIIIIIIIIINVPAFSLQSSKGSSPCPLL